MRYFVTDYEAKLLVRAPLRWHRHPGSALHQHLKAALDRVDPAVRVQLLAPTVPDPPPHFSLRTGEPAPAALIPILPRSGAGPQGTLMPDDLLTVRLRRLGRADRHVDHCIEDALAHLDDALLAETITRCGPRERAVVVDERPRRETTLVLCFLTPGHLEAAGRVRVNLDFQTLIGLVRRRLEVICALYGEFPAGSSERFRGALWEVAPAVVPKRRRLHLERWQRASSRSGGESTHRMIGLLGDTEFQGPLDAFVPTLIAAQDCHIGKLTSMGLGRIAVTLPASPST